MFLKRMGAKRKTNRGQQAGYNPNLADLFRLRQMEKIIHLTVEELELIKSRLSRLEEAMGINVEQDVTLFKGSQRPGQSRSMPVIPIAEMKQLAEMARRFR